MFRVQYRALSLSINAFSRFCVNDIFAAARGPYRTNRIQHSGDKPYITSKKADRWGSQKPHACISSLASCALSDLVSTALPQHLGVRVQ